MCPPQVCVGITLLMLQSVLDVTMLHLPADKLQYVCVCWLELGPADHINVLRAHEQSCVLPAMHSCGRQASDVLHATVFGLLECRFQSPVACHKQHANSSPTLALHKSAHVNI